MRSPPAERTAAHRVTAAEAGARLDVLATALPLLLSRAHAQRLIHDGRITLNDAPSRPSARVRAGDRVEVSIPPPAPAAPAPEAIPLAVLHEDAHLIVIVKPPGMVVHPAAGARTGTLVNALLAHCKDLSGIGGVERPGIVHRLDRGTSGVLVVAKTDLSHRALSAQFKEHSVDRRYLALCHGRVSGPGTLSSLLGRDPHGRKRFTGRVRRGKPAVTHYDVHERFPGFTLLAVRPQTGRTHQIRVHLSEAGHPIAGDPTYGRGHMGPEVPARVREAVRALGHQALHAERLGIVHPATGERLLFEAPPPPDLADLLALLRGPSSG